MVLLEVQPAQHAPGGAALVVLHKFLVDTGLCELVLLVGLHKIAAVVAEHLRLNDHNTGDLGLSKRKLAHILYLSFVKHVCFIWKSLFDAGFCAYLPRRVCPCSVRVLRRFFRQVMNRTTRKVTSAAASVDPSEMPSSQNAWLWGFTALAASNS